ncbi:MAG: hypothetical protein ACR2II_12260 [Chthoniobacterales bacterium]
MQRAETIDHRSFSGVRASPRATDTGASVRIEHVGCTESGLSRLLREDEVLHFAAAKSDAIDFGKSGKFCADRHDCAGLVGSVARNPDDLHLSSSVGFASPQPRTTATRGSLHVSHLIHGR